MSILQKSLDALRSAVSEDPRFSYYEYKYLVPHERLSSILAIMNELHHDSDPFTEGVVDSIYYDTQDEICYHQCLEGDAKKFKFRIRGYGDNTYRQVHQKFKDLQGVSKYKAKIQPVRKIMNQAPEWDQLLATSPQEEGAFAMIRYNSSRVGPLIPSIQVKYHRYRFRLYDIRMTLDTNIEVFALANGLPRSRHSSVLPLHVLEVKTHQTRPILPFIGLVKLPQVSFSKFMLGIQHLS
jgi:hypothetical protein